LANAVGKNYPYKYENSGKFKPDPDALWYPGNGADVNFVAYYPWNSSATTANTVTYTFADQSTQSLKEAVDFCFHRGVTAYNNEHANATHPSMQFYHKFSKIKMTVNGTNGPDLSDLVVKLTKMPASATVNLAVLTSTPSSLSALGVGTAPTTITAWTTRTATSATVEAIVAPHPGGGDFTGRTITFTTGSGGSTKTDTYPIPDNVTFESGKVYNYTVTFAEDITPQPETTSVDDMTNCYIVAPNGTVTFAVSRAYTYNATDKKFNNTLHVGGTHTLGFEAKVIWQDPSDLIESPTSTASAISGSGNTATVTVKAKNSKSGNAVIGIYKPGETTPVWSYHIWVTSYTGTPTASNNGFVFMDRNLGATVATPSLAARGLFYQWGRKDPFPGGKEGTAGFAERAKFYGINDTGFNTAEVKVTGSDNAECIIESIQKPTTFFTNYNNNYDWLITLKNDLWNIRESNKDIKTIYDPCPSGWRVPAHKDNSASDNNSPWNGYLGSTFTRGDTGAINFGTNAVYPAAGYRGISRGTLANDGYNGNYWSGSITTTIMWSGAYLSYGDDGSIYITAPGQRAYGFSVRCVRE
jgi:hypothetical protein